MTAFILMLCGLATSTGLLASPAEAPSPPLTLHEATRLPAAAESVAVLAPRAGECWCLSATAETADAGDDTSASLCPEFAACPDLLWYHPRWLENVSGKV